MPTFSLHLPIQVALIAFEDVRVSSDEGAHEQLRATAARYRDAGAGPGVPSPGEIEGVQWARSLFRALGIDPTRRRPSSEALLNRALKDKSLPRISSLVDVGNWCSLDFLLPLGLYDTDRIRGPVVLRRGGPGDTYRALNGRDVDLDGRYLLADDEGAFGSPMVDSVRTAVDERTTSAVVFLYAPMDYDRERLRDQAATLAARVGQYCGGRAIQSDLICGRG